MSPHGGPRVLVVDDNDDFRIALCALLEDYEIDVAGEGTSGSHAVRIVESVDPDVVLMDLRMPGMDGIEAAREIRRQMPHVQVVILSAYDDLALRADAAEADVYTYLVKGSHPDLVKSTIMDAWSARRAAAAAASGA